MLISRNRTRFRPSTIWVRSIRYEPPFLIDAMITGANPAGLDVTVDLKACANFWRLAAISGVSSGTVVAVSRNASQSI